MAWFVGVWALAIVFFLFLFSLPIYLIVKAA